MRKKKKPKKKIGQTFAVQPSQLKHIRQAAFDRNISVSKYIGSRDEDRRYYWVGLR